MDQEKIGAFIAACRKEAGYTQAALGEKLGITDRAVSKWETGKSMPDPSLMLELCGLLHINVNELLTGARMDMERYQEQAEKHLLELQRQEAEQNKKLLSLETVIAASATVNYLVMIFAAVFAVEMLAWRLALVLTGLAILVAGGGAGPAHRTEPEHEMSPLRTAGISQKGIDQMMLSRGCRKGAAPGFSGAGALPPHPKRQKK